jgi:hypothetical protein
LQDLAALQGRSLCNSNHAVQYPGGELCGFYVFGNGDGGGNCISNQFAAGAPSNPQYGNQELPANFRCRLEQRLSSRSKELFSSSSICCRQA